MRPTEILMSEHRVIEKVIAAVEAALERAGKGDFDQATFAGALEFFREFADKRHHGKEEDRLFPLLVRRGIPKDGGPIGCMLSEHDYGRELLGKVREALPAAGSGDAAARAAITGAYRDYVEFLRDHIMKEDNVLFRMADSVLTDEDQAQLEAAFAEFDRDAIGAEELVRWAKMAEAIGAGA